MDLDEGETPTETPGAKFKIFVPMVKAFREKAAGSDEEDFFISGIASSTIKDLHGDRMEGTALKDMLRAAKGNLTIFLNHSYSVPKDVAGSVRKARLIQQSDNVVDLVFDKIRINKRNADAVEAFLSIEDGTKLGLSIGALIPEGGAHFDPKQNGWVIEHVELLETSIVGVPANPRSWIDYAVKSMSGHYPEQFKNVIKRAGLEIATKGISQWISEGTDDVDSQGIDPAIFEDADDEMHEVVVAAGTMGPMHGIEVPEGMTVTVSVDENGNSMTKVEPIKEGDVGFVGNLEPPVALAQTKDINDETSLSGDDAIDVVADSQLTEDTTPDDTAQGAPQSNPETGVEASGDAEVPPDADAARIQLAVDTLDPVLMASLESGASLITALTSELGVARKARDEAFVARDEAVKNRDEALALAEKVMAGTTEILTQLSRLPVGKRAVAVKAETEFEGLTGYYDAKVIEVLRSMKK